MERYRKDEKGNVWVEHRWDKDDNWVKLRIASIEELIYELIKKQ